MNSAFYNLSYHFQYKSVSGIWVKLSTDIKILLASILLILVLPVLCFGQEQSFLLSEPADDSLYLVQFIALKDCSRSFNGLKKLGQVIKKYSESEDICRYSIAYFEYREDAVRTQNELVNVGFTDAFIRVIRKEATIAATRLGLENFEAKEDVSIRIEEESKEVSNVKPESPQLAHDRKKEFAEEHEEEASFSLLYTGKSLGVLGQTRFQKEHDLATEYAIENEIQFKLVSHACWRAHGLTVFMPSDEPLGHELDLILNNRNEWKVTRDVAGLKTNSVVLFGDDERI